MFLFICTYTIPAYRVYTNINNLVKNHNTTQQKNEFLLYFFKLPMDG